jgi:hypothetical protein
MVAKPDVCEKTSSIDCAPSMIAAHAQYAGSQLPARSNTASHPRACSSASASVLSKVTTTAAYSAGTGTLHHALQYHCKGEDLRIIEFSALDGQQLLGVLSLLDEEGLPSQFGVWYCIAAYTRRVDPKQSVRACSCCGELYVLATHLLNFFFERVNDYASLE